MQLVSYSNYLFNSCHWFRCHVLSVHVSCCHFLGCSTFIVAGVLLIYLRNLRIPKHWIRFMDFMPCCTSSAVIQVQSASSAALVSQQQKPRHSTASCEGPSSYHLVVFVDTFKFYVSATPTPTLYPQRGILHPENPNSRFTNHPRTKRSDFC